MEIGISMTTLISYFRRSKSHVWSQFQTKSRISGFESQASPKSQKWLIELLSSQSLTYTDLTDLS